MLCFSIRALVGLGRLIGRGTLSGLSGWIGAIGLGRGAHASPAVQMAILIGMLALILLLGGLAAALPFWQQARWRARRRRDDKLVV